ncbi:Hypothetical predicted protein, partial [Drosophila guanche]
LDGLGMQLTDGEWTFSEVVASQERMQLLDRSAGEAFSRRLQLLDPSATSGLTAPDSGCPLQGSPFRA